MAKNEEPVAVVTQPENAVTAQPEKTSEVPVNFQNPVSDFSEINQGTVAIETGRAVAEAQGKLIIAKRFPRDETKSYARVMESCRRPKTAASAFFSYPRSGKTVEGVTIRFAEELARCWGNIDYGIKELSRDDSKSEMQAYAWDTETNVRSEQNFTNPHMREVNGKMKPLTTDRDIYENNANMGARRLRARILAVLPSYLVEDAIAECKKTLAGQNDVPLSDRVNRMVAQFLKFGVSVEQIEKRLGRAVSTMTTEDFVEYISIYNSLADGATKPSEWFDSTPEASELDSRIKELSAEKAENT